MIPLDGACFRHRNDTIKRFSFTHNNAWFHYAMLPTAEYLALPARPPRLPTTRGSIGLHVRQPGLHRLPPLGPRQPRSTLINAFLANNRAISPCMNSYTDEIARLGIWSQRPICFDFVADNKYALAAWLDCIIYLRHRLVTVARIRILWWSWQQVCLLVRLWEATLSSPVEPTGGGELWDVRAQRSRPQVHSARIRKWRAFPAARR